MKKLLSILLLVFVSVPLLGQKGIIHGKVVSEGEPVFSAFIQVVDADISTFSRQDGTFQIEGIVAGECVIQVSLLGFETTQVKVLAQAINQSEPIYIELLQASDLLEEVVVSGTLKEVSKLESPVTVAVYQADFFKANPNPSLFESLQQVNGVRPQVNCNVCNTGDIRMNGLDGPYTMVLIDGMPIVSGLGSVYGFNGIPQALIERIEVVKGPASTLYGSEAVGGLINIITKNANNVPRLAADVRLNSWLEVNTDVGGHFNISPKTQAIVGLNYFNYQLPVDNNGDGFTDLALQNRISLFNKWQVDLVDDRQLMLAGRYVYEDRWGGQMNWNRTFRGGDSVYGESITTKRWELMSSYQLPFQDEVMLTVSLNGHQQRSAYGTMIFDADQYIGFAQLTWRKEIFAKNELLFGAASRFTYYDDNTVATAIAENPMPINNPSITWLPGIFAQNEISLNPQNKLLLGLRYDYNSIHGSILSPRLNYKWNSKNKRSVLRLGVGNGYRVANIFTEDHAALTGAREVIIATDLMPETSWNANLNVSHTFATANSTYINVDGSLFYTYFSNRIIPDYETNPNQIIYANLNGHAISRGLSFNTSVTLPFGLSINAGITAMDVFFEVDGVRNRPFFTEQFSAVWQVSYPVAPFGLTVDYTGNLYSPMRLPLLSDLDPRSPYSPWFSIQNIQLTKALLHGLDLYGGVQNLLNYTPPANSIARPNDPFDKQVQFDADGNAISNANNPYALTFDPSYVYASNQGIRFFLGLRYHLD